MATEYRPIDLSPRISGANAGNTFFDIIALTNVDLEVAAFLKDVDGDFFGRVEAPQALHATPNPSIVLEVMANATTGDVKLNVHTKCVSKEGESFDVTLTAHGAQTTTMPATARQAKLFTFTGGDLGNLAAGDVVVVKIVRDGAAAADTLAVTLELLRAWLKVDVP